MSASTYPTTTEQIDRCNATGRTPVVFVHGLWLLPRSWDRWAAVFEEAGYTALTPGWPDDPETVQERTPTPKSSRTRPSDKWPTTSQRSSASWITSRP
jgi:non-heme chloroperoxidase